MVSCWNLCSTLSIFYLSDLPDALEYITELIGDFLYFNFHPFGLVKRVCLFSLICSIPSSWRYLCWWAVGNWSCLWLYNKKYCDCSTGLVQSVAVNSSLTGSSSASCKLLGFIFTGSIRKCLKFHGIYFCCTVGINSHAHQHLQSSLTQFCLRHLFWLSSLALHVLQPGKKQRWYTSCVVFTLPGLKLVIRLFLQLFLVVRPSVGFRTRFSVGAISFPPYKTSWSFLS